MSSGRVAAASDLKTRIQQSADDLKLGVSIEFVGLQEIHPPANNGVAASFEQVNAAFQERESTILQARGYLATKVNRAQAEARRQVNDAKAQAARRVAESQAVAATFSSQLAAYRTSPELYLDRLHLRAFTSSVTNSRQYVLMTSNRTEVIEMNLEQKIRSDLFDVPLPTIAGPPKPNP